MLICEPTQSLFLFLSVLSPYPSNVRNVRQALSISTPIPYSKFSTQTSSAYYSLGHNLGMVTFLKPNGSSLIVMSLSSKILTEDFFSSLQALFFLQCLEYHSHHKSFSGVFTKPRVSRRQNGYHCMRGVWLKNP